MTKIMTREEIQGLAKFAISNNIIDDDFLDTRPKWLKDMIKRPHNKYYFFFHLLTNKLKPKLIVETGTNRGTSAAHFKDGWKDAMVITIDKFHPDPVKRFLRKMDIFGVEKDSVQALYTIPGQIDILFLDTIHTYELTLAEFKTALPKVKEGGLIFFDDIYLNSGMKRFWAELDSNNTIDLSELHPDCGFGGYVV